VIKGVERYESAEGLYEELRSEAMDACYERYLLEFRGCFESVVRKDKIDNKGEVARVAEALVGIGLLMEE
jgi:predicted alpha/beta-fold hydrolase